jgi:copper transport protein
MAIRLLVAALVAVCVVTLGLASPALAHNAITGSDPADGGTVTTGRASLVLSFQQPVPLASASVEFIDPVSGTRTPATALGHGTTTRDVVVGVPALPSGTVTARWRLVGDDGHVVSGRVELVAAPDTAAVTTPVTTPVSASGTAPTDPSGAAATAVTGASVGSVGDWTTPAGVGWVLRLLGYLALVAVVGVLAATVAVWPGALAQPVLARVAVAGAVGVAGLAAVQLVLLAGDVAGRPPWDGIGALGTALGTDVGVALAARIVLGVGVVALLSLVPADLDGPDRRRIRVELAVVVAALLATWSFAGHAWSQRWGGLGVPLDVAHHAAAATWLGGLVVLAVAALRSDAGGAGTAEIARFGRVAAVAVGVLAVTGLVQSVRLLGGPGALFDGHGRLLVVKLVVLAAMLAVADRNRRRLRRWSAGLGLDVGARRAVLRRAVVTEFVAGVVILAVTAVMVVTAPAVGTSG